MYRAVSFVPSHILPALNWSRVQKRFGWEQLERQHAFPTTNFIRSYFFGKSFDLQSYGSNLSQSLEYCLNKTSLNYCPIQSKNFNSIWALNQGAVEKNGGRSHRGRCQRAEKPKRIASIAKDTKFNYEKPLILGSSTRGNWAFGGKQNACHQI